MQNTGAAYLFTKHRFGQLVVTILPERNKNTKNIKPFYISDVTVCKYVIINS